MEILKASKSKALDLFVKSKGEGRDILKELFPDIEFSDNIMDRVKSFEDACQITGEDPNDDKFSEGTADEINYKKLKVVIRALNEDWVPDFNNKSQYKWSNWFYLDKPGFRFVGTHYGVAIADTTGGSRLCFKSEELAKYAANQFIGLYEGFLS